MTTNDIYVSPSGDNSNNGSFESPLKTVSKAFQMSLPGNVINLRQGTYREKIDVYQGGGTREAPVTLKPYQDEKVILKGSDIVTDWKIFAGSVWMKQDVGYNPQQVFVDFDSTHKYPLKQISRPVYNYSSFQYPEPHRALSDMVQGSFYYDSAVKTLFIWLEDGSNPNEHTIEVSSRSRILFLGVPFVNIEGLSFYHSSGTGEQTSAVELGPNSTMDNCNIEYCDFAGLGMGYLKTDTRVFNSNISHNGNSGINAPGTKNFLVSNCRMNGNNYRQFNPLWHAGGFKAAADAYGTVEKCEVGFNQGSGIWFDYCNGGARITINDNYIHDNQPKDSAIFLEVCKNVKVYSNRVENNTRRGIYISASDDVEVYDNLFKGTKGHATVDLGGMPRDNNTLTNNYIHDNIIESSTTNYDIGIAIDNGTTITNNKSDKNQISRLSGEPLFMYGGTRYIGLKAWQLASKQDLNSNTSTAPEPEPLPEEPEQPPAPDPVSTTQRLSVGVNQLVDLVDGAKYTGIVDVLVSAVSDQPITAIALYINGDLKLRVQGNTLRYTWDTSTLPKNRSHTFYISAIDKSNKLQKKYIKVYVI